MRPFPMSRTPEERTLAPMPVKKAASQPEVAKKLDPKVKAPSTFKPQPAATAKTKAS